MATFIKATAGEVIQHFDDNGKLMSQEFRAGDMVEYYDPDGGEIIPTPDNEQYAGFDMVQPTGEE